MWNNGSCFSFFWVPDGSKTLQDDPKRALERPKSLQGCPQRRPKSSWRPPGGPKRLPGGSPGSAREAKNIETPLGFYVFPYGPRMAQEAIQTPQVASRDLPGGRLGPSRGLKTAPRRLKTGLRRPQGSPETAEELPGRPQTGPRAAQDGPTNSPRQAQMCSTTSLKRGVVEQNGPQNSSKDPGVLRALLWGRFVPPFLS